MTALKIHIIGQAPPAKPASRPYGRSHLYNWLSMADIDLTTAEYSYDSILLTFPGLVSNSHVAPSHKQQVHATSRLAREVSVVCPNMILVLGLAAARGSLGISKLNVVLDDLIGLHRASLVSLTVPLVVWPHPSGRSTWTYNDPRRIDRMIKALNEGLLLGSSL